jgi:alpha,alpha-trehalase
VGVPDVHGTGSDPAGPVIDRSSIDAVIFDMDGVITDTARVHSAAWKRLFDDYLREHAEAQGTEFSEFTGEDYRAYVDGKPRFDGVRSFLASRGIELAEGPVDAPPGDDTVQALGNKKNGFFIEALQNSGADAYEGSVDLVHRLQEAGIGTAIISASVNAAEVLAAAGVGDLFSVRVDGVVAHDLGLPGKPDPAVFVEAARRLGASPQRSVVVEDAQAGVEAGKNGEFALVIGVDRGGNEVALREHGADVVVDDLGTVRIEQGGPAE